MMPGVRAEQKCKESAEINKNSPFIIYLLICTVKLRLQIENFLTFEYVSPLASFF